LANVSRNSLYRYHAAVLRELREHQRRHGAGRFARTRPHREAEQAELIELRQQVAKLVALVDHFYAAYRETHSLLGRREQEIAELRRRLDLKPSQFRR
jgi:transposase-like protein